MMMDDRSSPGKIFEYIGAGKKILGCVPQGSMRTMIEEAGGTCVEPHDVAGIARVLKELYEQFERRKLRGARPEIVDKYNRRAITGDLARILSQLIG
jgi:glycosyltransferase involved in cell wall biosynthesis